MRELYVDRSGGVLYGGAAEPVRFTEGAAQPDLAAALACSASRSRRWPRAALRVWLSACVARPFLVPPVAGVRSWSEARTLAAAAARSAAGIDRPCRVELHDWPGDAAALAIAADAATLDRIEGCADRARLRVVSIRPWWAGMLDRILARRPSLRLLVVTERGALTVLGGSGRRFDIAMTLEPAPSADEQRALIARLTLSSGASADEVAQVRCPIGATADTAALWCDEAVR